MNKYFTICLLLLTLTGNAQSFFGLQHDNYAGVNAILSNPANIVDSRFRSDINLFSGDINFSNSYYSFTLQELFDGQYDTQDNSSNTSGPHSLYTKVDYLGPSFMFDISKNQSLAFSTRLRVIGHITQLDGNLINSINDNDAFGNYSISNQNFSIAYNSWAEIGATYARVLADKKMHFLKGGISLKYVYGLNTGFVKANNLSVQFNDFNNTYTTTGSVEVGNTNSFDDVKDPFDNQGAGFGADIGFTYEYRSESRMQTSKGSNKYLYRLGFSILDIGYLTYNDAKVNTYSANATITESQFENESFDSFYTRTSTTNKINVSLPTSANVNLDWSMSSRLFLNVNTSLSLVKNTNVNSNYIANNVSVTPRFESKWLSIYLPFSYLKYAGFQSGFGLRMGPLFVGSGSVINGLLGKTKAVDVNFGLKIPIFYGKK
jgi:hypothetical protein